MFRQLETQFVLFLKGGKPGKVAGTCYILALYSPSKVQSGYKTSCILVCSAYYQEKKKKKQSLIQTLSISTDLSIHLKQPCLGLGSCPARTASFFLSTRKY